MPKPLPLVVLRELKSLTAASAESTASIIIKYAHIARPVRPLPALQWTAIVFSRSYDKYSRASITNLNMIGTGPGLWSIIGK
jgi:hypothetical protein